MKLVDIGFEIKFGRPRSHCTFTQCMAVASNYYVNRTEIILDEDGNELLSKYLQLRRIPYTHTQRPSRYYLSDPNESELTDQQLYLPYITRIEMMSSASMSQELGRMLRIGMNLDTIRGVYLSQILRAALSENCVELVRRILETDTTAIEVFDDKAVLDSVNAVGIHVMLQFEQFTERFNIHMLFGMLINLDKSMSYCTQTDRGELWDSVNPWTITNVKAFQYITNRRPTCNQVMDKLITCDENLKAHYYQVCEGVIPYSDEFDCEKYLGLLLNPYRTISHMFGESGPHRLMCLILELFKSNKINLIGYERIHPCIDHLIEIVRGMSTKSARNVVK